MKLKLIRQAIGVLLYVIVTTCYSTSTSIAGTPNDQENYLGDRIRLLVDINATKTNKNTEEIENTENEKFVMDAQAKVDSVIVSVKKKELEDAASAYETANNDSNSKKLEQAKTNFAQACKKAKSNASKANKNGSIVIPARTSMIVIGKENDDILLVKLEVPERGSHRKGALDPNVSYSIRKDDLYNSGLARTGITYGGLVVPFKYQLMGNHDLTGAGTIGAYVGYRIESIDIIGLGLTPIAFGGATTYGNSGSDSNLLGISGGFGLISTIKGAFQMGGVIGWDHFGGTNNYQYNGKPWVAIEIGYAFLQ
jgi:hypothetical protein